MECTVKILVTQDLQGGSAETDRFTIKTETDLANAIARALDQSKTWKFVCILIDEADGDHYRTIGIAERQSSYDTLGSRKSNHAKSMRAAAEYRKNRKAIRDEYVENGKCARCGGAGIIAAFKHINGGTCFECEGDGLAHAKAAM
jgi:hypothetical protein